MSTAEQDGPGRPTGPVRGHFRLTDLQRVTHGVYRPRFEPAEDGFREDLRAWRLVLPHDGVFTHLTAAALRGWQLPPLPDAVPVFAAIPNTAASPRRPWLVVSRLERPLDHRGLPVGPDLMTDTGAEVLLRAARDLAVLDVVVLVDSALRAGDVDEDEMAAMLESRRPGTRVLRRAWQFGDGRAESAWESVLRVFHQVMEVPVDPQVELWDEDGTFVARGDLLVRGRRMVQEYDGAGHRRQRQHARDLRRDRALLSAGYERRGYTRSDLVETPAAAMRELDRALGRPTQVNRLRRWTRLVADSAHSPAGRARLVNRWRRWQPPVD